MNGKNILIYFGDQLCPTGGGTERVACLLADYFKSKGAKLHYLACRSVDIPNAIESEFLPDRIELPTPNNIRAVNEIIKERKIDIIINEGGFGDVAKLFSHEHIPDNVKIITHLHFDPLRGQKYYYSGLYLPLSLSRGGFRNFFTLLKSPYHKMKFVKHIKKRFEYILENSDTVVVLCPRHKAILGKMVKPRLADKIVSMTNPLTFGTPEEINFDKQNEIIYVGRLEYSPKRVDRVIRAWDRISDANPDWRLTIIGDGNDRKRLENLCRNLGEGERVTFAGRTNPAPYYERAKILLLTSNHEGTPMVIQEAMSYGVVPIVMNSFSSAPDMIQSGSNGLLIKPFDISSMSNAIENLIRYREYYDSLSHNAYMTIKEMDNSLLLEKWDEVIG